MKVEKWAALPDGSAIYSFELVNKNGITVKLINFGGIITSILTPDKNGVFGDIVLGYDTIGEFQADNAYLGAMIGRYANRIGKSKFTLGGKEYKVTVNEGQNHLHGGKGFHKSLWDWTVREDELLLKIKSPDGEDGYPGNVEAWVSVKLDDSDRLILEFGAVSDQDTVMNLTNHAYFNLACGGKILNHKLKIDADHYMPVDNELIPTGEVKPVAETDFDFRTLRTVKNEFYDHNFVLNKKESFDAEVYDPQSGRVLLLTTNMPGLQFYDGGGLSDRKGKDGASYGKNSAFCLEPQYFPNTPNVPYFPSCVLKAGEEYNHKIVYEFKTR